jgi:phage terminase small subunit
MPRHSTASGLTAKEERFVPEYLVDGNATRAAIAAGYSERTAARIGSELLTKPHIKAAIAKGLKAQEKRTLVKADANLLAIEMLARKAEGAGEFAAAIRARELIGKHYKSFTDRLEVRDTTPRAERLAAARARRRAASE